MQLLSSIKIFKKKKKEKHLGGSRPSRERTDGTRSIKRRNSRSSRTRWLREGMQKMSKYLLFKIGENLKKLVSILLSKRMTKVTSRTGYL